MLSKEQNAKILEETRYLVNLFLETNASDLELEKKTGISSSSIQRRLTNKKRIEEAFNNDKEIYELVAKRRKENLEKGKIRGGLTSQLNSMYGKENANNTKLRLDVFFDNEIAETEFLKNIALTFRANYDTLKELFNYDDDVLTKLFTGNAMEYLNSYDNTNQEFAKEEIISYYKSLLKAFKSKKNEEINKILMIINDTWKEDLINKIKSNKILDSNDYNNIFNYQLKYALREHEIEKIFGINKEIYFQNVTIILDSNIIFKNRYDSLKEYYLNKVRERRNAK